MDRYESYLGGGNDVGIKKGYRFRIVLSFFFGLLDGWRFCLDRKFRIFLYFIFIVVYK